MQNQDPLIGQQIDEYLIEDILGHGGMGRVYRGLDVKLNRYAAIKVMSQPDKNADVYRKRFDLEARAIARLDHPNIVTIYRFNDVNNIYYMAMQYIDGADLRWVLRDYEANSELLDYPTLFKIVEQVSSALDYAHKNGVIHRDIKPSNIMISRDGDAILTDFGLALDVQEGTGGEIFGSPHYIAPEQAVSSAQAVPQTDFYALGVILYEMLTGAVPFDVGSALQIAMAHIGDTLPDPKSINPDLHSAFIPVLNKMLEKKPEQRYQDGASLVLALKKAIQEAQRDKLDPAMSTLGRPKDRIAKNVPQIVDIQGKPATRLAPEPDLNEPPTKVYSEPEVPASPKRSYAKYYFLLIIAMLALAFVLYPDRDALVNLAIDSLISDNNNELINARVAGQVDDVEIRRDEASLSVYGMTIEIPRPGVFFDELERVSIENGTISTIYIDGHYNLTGEAVRFDRVDYAEIDGVVVDLTIESQ